MYASVYSEEAPPVASAAGEGLRIVHCFRSPVGGIFRHVRDLCAAQSAAGHRVGIVCDSSTGGAYEDRLFAQIEGNLALGVSRIPMQRHIGPGDLGAAWRTLSIVRGMKPDVLHGHGAKGGAYARLLGTALRATGHPVVRLYSPHGGSLHYDGSAGRVFFTIEKLLESFTDHILFVSAYEQRAYEQKVGRPRTRTSLIYNGLGAEEFEPVADAPGARDFVYIGMMRDLKGPDLFIDALKEAERRSGRALTAAMVGDGDDRDKYIAQANALGFGERIAFHPAMPARRAFALGRTMVVPSRAEAMPYIVLEALAAGRPMIATAVGGIPEILGRDSPALAAPEAHALAERMTGVLADEAAYRRQMPPRRLLEKRFSAATMATSIEAAYREAIGTRSR